MWLQYIISRSDGLFPVIRLHIIDKMYIIIIAINFSQSSVGLSNKTSIGCGEYTCMCPMYTILFVISLTSPDHKYYILIFREHFIFPWHVVTRPPLYKVNTFLDTL